MLKGVLIALSKTWSHVVPPNVKIETIQKTDLAVVVEVVPDEEVADGHPHLLVRPLHAAVPTISAEGREDT